GQPEVRARNKERAKTLPRRALEFAIDSAHLQIRKSEGSTEPAKHLATEVRAHGPVLVGNRKAIGTNRQRFQIVNHAIQFPMQSAGVFVRAKKLVRRVDHRLQERSDAGFRLLRSRSQAVNRTLNFVDRFRTHSSQHFANVGYQSAEESFHHLRTPRKTRPQLLILGCDSYGTSVEMTLPRHYAAHGQQRGGPETKFLGPEQSRHYHVAGKLQSAVHTQAHSSSH